MKVFAHRGLASLYPENTIVAFKKALEYEIDGIETDVQMTKDGALVIFHDEDLVRTTGVKGFLKDYTLAEIKKLNANNGYEGHFEIPTLDEFLDLVKDYDITINLELKTSVFDYPGIEKLVYDKIKEYKLENRIIISSFNHYSLLRYRRLDKDIKIGLLTADRLINPIKYIMKYHFNCYHPFFMALTKEDVEKAHKNNIDVNVWTVDIDEAYNMLKLMGADCIMTNCCNKYCKLK